MHPGSAAENAKALKSTTLRSIYEDYAPGVGEFHDALNEEVILTPAIRPEELTESSHRVVERALTIQP